MAKKIVKVCLHSKFISIWRTFFTKKSWKFVYIQVSFNLTIFFHRKFKTSSFLKKSWKFVYIQNFFQFDELFFYKKIRDLKIPNSWKIRESLLCLKFLLIWRFFSQKIQSSSFMEKIVKVCLHSIWLFFYTIFKNYNIWKKEVCLRFKFFQFNDFFCRKCHWKKMVKILTIFRQKLEFFKIEQFIFRNIEQSNYIVSINWCKVKSIYWTSTLTGFASNTKLTFGWKIS